MISRTITASQPNCATIIGLALWSSTYAGAKRIIASTYQAASGAGLSPGLTSLKESDG